MRFSEFCKDEIYVVDINSGDVTKLDEGKLVSGRFKNNIRVDHPTYGAGQTHAHIHCRKGNQVGVLNLDGTKSHGGESYTIHKNDAAALGALGFTVPEDGIVEWIKLDVSPALLFEASTNSAGQNTII